MTTFVTPIKPFIDDDDDKDDSKIVVQSVKKPKKTKNKKKSDWELDHEAKERILTAIFTYRQSGVEAQLDGYEFTWRSLDGFRKGK